MKSSLFLVLIALADTRIVGHMAPLNDELLPSTINLTCGLSIREWRGANFNQDAIDKLNKLCMLALNEFPSFIKENGLNIITDKPFNFNSSIIPSGHEYRDLNDIEYRFIARSDGDDHWGYTNYVEKYLFIFNDIKNDKFDVVFVHELFHAMSMHYGIFMNHSVDEDEKLARKFTLKLLSKE